jgi:zinc protease
VTNERTIASLGVTEWTLANGVRVVIKPTDFKNDEVQFSATSPGGLSLVADADLVAAQTTPNIIGESGVGNFDRTQLQKKLSDKIVWVSPYISEITEGMSGQASPKDLETLLQLVYLYFTSPRKDSTAYAVVRTRLEGVYQNRSLSPEAAFFDTVNAIFTNYHPRYRPMTVPRLSQMNLETSLKIYRDRFADASDFIFFFVGNVRIEELKPLVEKYLGGLPARGKKEQWGTATYDYPAGIIEREVKKGVEPKSLTSLIFSGPFEWNAENRFAADALLGILRIKLRERIREELGGTYGVQVRGMYPHFPKERYRITVQFGENPDRAEELTKEIFLQIDSLQQFGPSQSYVDKIKETNLREHETNLKENRYWISSLEFAFFHGEKPEDILRFEERNKNLSIEDLKKAARKYLVKDRYLRVVLYPQDWPSKK